MAMENKAGQAAQNVASQATNVADKARDAAANVAEQARQHGGVGQQVAHYADQARSAASHVGDQASQFAASAATAVRDAAGNLRDQMGSGGQAVSEYFQGANFDHVTDDLGALIRRNPLPAVLVGVGVGFLLGRMMRS